MRVYMPNELKVFDCVVFHPDEIKEAFHYIIYAPDDVKAYMCLKYIIPSGLMVRIYELIKEPEPYILKEFSRVQYDDSIKMNRERHWWLTGE